MEDASKETFIAFGSDLSNFEWLNLVQSTFDILSTVLTKNKTLHNVIQLKKSCQVVKITLLLLND
jgi:hypothetical protein